MRCCLWAILACCAMWAGCGTTMWSDTRRTATEQLLISDAMDRAVGKLEFRAVAGKKVYLDSSPLEDVIDSAYLVSLLRQHMLAEGCLLMGDREEADYVVEVRAGAVGTDRREVLFGIPAAKVGGVVPMPGVPTDLPEIPLATKTEQRAVAKIAVFAYNRHTGRPVWQSGVVPVESKTKDVWLLGAGPFQRGTIHEGTEFAGIKLAIPLIGSDKDEERGKRGELSVADEAHFFEPPELLAEDQSQPKREAASPQVENAQQQPPSPPSEDVIHADYTAPPPEPVSDSAPRPISGAQPRLKTPPQVPPVANPPLPQSQPAAAPPSGS